MGKIDTLYKSLAADQSPEADQILAAALEHAEPAYAARTTSILLRREHEPGWTGLVANYDRLTAEAQAQVLARPELLRAGMAGALGGASTRARRSALALLAEHPYPKLGYVLVDTLRDASPQIRAAAAVALRRCAAFVADGGHSAGASPTPSSPVERAAFVQALRDGLRTFHLHRQVEVLEAALWFARELGENLWAALADQRAHLGHVVEHNLREWDQPRLAGFLLRGLARPAWRQTAVTLLDTWHQHAHLVAVLQNSDVLNDPLVGEHLYHLKRPRWLVASAPDLSDLPPRLRAQLPYWVCRLGLSQEERTAFLTRWQASPWPEVQRAAVYALAALDLPATTAILTQVATDGGPAARFARWFLDGKRALAIGDRIWRIRRSHPVQLPAQERATTEAVR